MATQRQLQYRAQQGLRGNTPPASDVWRWQGFTAPGVGRITNASGVEIVAPVQGNASTAIGAQVLYIPGQPTGVIRLKEVVVPGVPPIIRPTIPVVILYAAVNSEISGFDFYVWFEGSPARLVHSQPNCSTPTGRIVLTSATAWIATIAWVNTADVVIPRYFEAGFVTNSTPFTPVAYPDGGNVQIALISKGKIGIYENTNGYVGSSTYTAPTGLVFDNEIPATTFSQADAFRRLVLPITDGVTTTSLLTYAIENRRRAIALFRSETKFAYFFVNDEFADIPGRSIEVSSIADTGPVFEPGEPFETEILTHRIINPNETIQEFLQDVNTLSIFNKDGLIEQIIPSDNRGRIMPTIGSLTAPLYTPVDEDDQLQQIPSLGAIIPDSNHITSPNDSAAIIGRSIGTDTLTYQDIDNDLITLTPDGVFNGGAFAALESSRFYAVNILGALSSPDAEGFINVFTYDIDSGLYAQTGTVPFKPPLAEQALRLDAAVWPRKLKNILPF